MSRKIYVNPSGLSHKLCCDTQTIVNRFERGQLEAQAFLRKGSKLIPLFEDLSQSQPEPRETLTNVTA